MNRDNQRPDSLQNLYFEAFHTILVNDGTLMKQEEEPRKAIDNYKHNFFHVDRYWESFNKEVKIKFQKADVPSILSIITSFLREYKIREQRTSKASKYILSLFQQEYEIWELLDYLNLADTVHHDGKYKIKESTNHCLKTLQQTWPQMNHKNLVIIAAARWLEKSYENPALERDLPSKHLLDGTNKPLEDFDTDDSFTSDQNFSENERQLLESIFQHLRAGQLFEVEQKLFNSQCYDHLSIIVGSNVLFDNIEFKEQMTDTRDLFITDFERQSQISNVDQSVPDQIKGDNDQQMLDDAAFDAQQNGKAFNTVYGNRNYLMFIDQYYETIKDQKKYNSNEILGHIQILRNGILALQCGDRVQIEQALRLSQNQDQAFKNYLWSCFRSISQKILINSIIEGKKKGALDDYETYYSDFIKEDGLNRLNQTFRDPLNNIDTDSIFKYANDSSKHSLSWFEGIQKMILKASFESSIQQKNVWDELLAELANQVNKEHAQLTQKKTLSPFDSQEVLELEYTFKLRLSTHLAMYLLMKGRITNHQTYINHYNGIVKKMIDYLKDKFLDKIPQIIFYISFLIGEDTQITAFANALKDVRDTSHQKQIKMLNQQYFQPQLAEKFMRAISEERIYHDMKKENFWNEINTRSLIDSVDFENDLSPEDQNALEILRWLYQQNDLRNALYYTNEFARKLLLAGNFKGVHTLLASFQWKGRVNPQDLWVKELNALSASLLHPDLFEADAKKQELLAYMRERERIEQLLRVMEETNKTNIQEFEIRDIQNKNYLQNLKSECDELLFSQIFPGSILLSDSEDYSELQDIKGDSQRLGSIITVNKKYCIKVLDTLFQIKHKLGELEQCLTFITDIQLRDSRVLNYISKDDMFLLINRMTSVMLESQTIMHEILESDDLQQ